MRKSSYVNVISAHHSMQARLQVIVSKALYIVPSINNIRRFVNASWRKEGRALRASGAAIKQKSFMPSSTVVLGVVGNKFKLSGTGSLRAIVRIKGK